VLSIKDRIIIVLSAIISIIVILGIIFICILLNQNKNLDKKIIELQKIEADYSNMQKILKENEKKLEKIKEEEALSREKIEHIFWNDVDLSDDPVFRRSS
jgi:hypothetical protein